MKRLYSNTVRRSLTKTESEQIQSITSTLSKNLLEVNGDVKMTQSYRLGCNIVSITAGCSRYTRGLKVDWV